MFVRVMPLLRLTVVVCGAAGACGRTVTRRSTELSYLSWPTPACSPKIMKLFEALKRQLLVLMARSFMANSPGADDPPALTVLWPATEIVGSARCTQLNETPGTRIDSCSTPP